MERNAFPPVSYLIHLWAKHLKHAIAFAIKWSSLYRSSVGQKVTASSNVNSSASGSEGMGSDSNKSDDDDMERPIVQIGEKTPS